VFLEIGDVHDYAKVTLNGKEVGARGFQPYRWDVTSALKPGTNELVIEVNATVEGRGAGGAPPPAAVATAAPAPGLAAAPAAGGAGGGRRRQGAGGAAAAGGAAPAGAVYGAVGGGGRTTPAPPATSGLLGEVKLVAH
jgi:hypothetical protein